MTSRIAQLASSLSLITITALLLGAASCSRDDAPDPGPPTQPEASAWESVLDRIGDDGTVTKETALAAFSLAIAPVPGVAPPPGRREPIRSGTAAVTWTLAHWAELDAARRAAVLAAVTAGNAHNQSPTSQATSNQATSNQATSNQATTDQPAAFRRSVARKAEDPDVPCQAADSPDASAMRAVLNRQVDAIATRLGRRLRLPTRLSMNKTNQEGDSAMYAVYCSATRRAKTTHECTIHVNPAAAKYADPERAAALAHEAMHCFLMDSLGRGEDALPPWLQEGIPMWVETAVAGGSTVASQAWQKYLTLNRTSLYKRSYDALGFFAQLANSGVDVWKRIDPMTQAAVKGGNEAAWGAATAGPAFLRVWAAGHARGARPGKDWDITGYGISAFKPRIPARGGATLAASAPVAGVDVISVTLPPNSAVTVAGDPAASGLLGLADGDHAIADLMGTTVCTGGCTCKTGSPRAGTTLPSIAAGPGLLAVTGGPAAARVTLTVQAVDGFCARPVHCVVGTWKHAGADIRYNSPDLTMKENGGAGFILRIGPDGASTVDFNPMQPVRFSSSTGIVGALRYHGQATYHLVLPKDNAATGRLKADKVDLGRVTATAQITKPFAMTVFENEPLASMAAIGGGVRLDSQPLAGEHTFECSSTRLVLAMVPGGELSGSWTFTRA
jgi:hypothetical protein